MTETKTAETPKSKMKTFECPLCKDRVKAIATTVSHNCPKNPTGTKPSERYRQYIITS
jgi:hypothetical protein